MSVGVEEITEEIAAIETALETEQNMMARQRLLKQRWNLGQAVASVEKVRPSVSQGEDHLKQNECDAA